MSTGAHTPARRLRLGHALELIGILVALAPLVVKAIIPVTNFPGWEFDPFTFPSASTGIGPFGSMACDAISVIGVIGALAGRFLTRSPLAPVQSLLAAVGLVGVSFHFWSADGPTINDAWIGSSWGAAILVGLLLACTPRTPHGDRIRAIVTAVMLGFVTLLALRAAQQVFIEHPQTLAEFRRNRVQIFTAQGWSPDSPMARAYERRILQPEATGWFGLANVLATFGAAGTVSAVGALIAALRVRRSSSPAVIAGAIATLVASAAVVILAGGKGGYAAAALGLAVLGAFAFLQRLKRPGLGGVISLGAVAATLALIALGSKTEQLSLLFRWFYMQAAIRIGIDNMPFGVGPDGFQDAYMLAKNPLSPEDVTSSHNVLLDWFATLGVFGLAWAILWCIWIWRTGVHAVSSVSSVQAPADDGARVDRWCVSAVGVAATLVALRIDQDMMTPDMALTRVLGVVAFIGVGWLTLSLLRRDTVWIHRAVAGGAVAAAAHSLIDVTGVWPSSTGMLLVLLGLGASGIAPGERRLPFILVPAVLLSLLGLKLFQPIARVLIWESALRDWAARAAHVGEITQRWHAAQEGLRLGHPSAPIEARTLAIELAEQINRPDPPFKAEEFDAALRLYDLSTAEAAASYLEKKLLALMPREWRVRREVSHLWLRIAALRDRTGDQQGAAEARSHAIAVAAAIPPGSESAAGLAWLSMAFEACAAGPAAQEQEWFAKAADALERAATLAPYELQYPTRLMTLWERAGEVANARKWALRALELDAALKYDREVKALSPADREHAVRLSGGS